MSKRRLWACREHNTVNELAVNTIPFVEIHGILLMLLNTCVHANLILIPTIGLLLLPSWYKKHFNGVFNFIDVHNIFNRRTDLHTISLMTCYCCFSPVGPFRLQEANLPIYELLLLLPILPSTRKVLKASIWRPQRLIKMRAGLS